MTPGMTSLLNAITVVVTPLGLFCFILLHARRDRDQEHRLETAIRHVDDALGAADLVTSEELTPLAEQLDRLRAEVDALASSIEQSRVETPCPSSDPVALEHRILGESWKQFRKNADRCAALDDALQDRGWTLLLDQLAAAVPAELKASFDAAVDRCREQRSILQRVELIPQIADGTFARLPDDAEEIRRTRELATLLTSAVDKVTEFRFKHWITDSFLPFADLYLLRYQQARLEKRDGEMRDGLLLVRQVLHAADVQPIEITPGETLFDSARHIGRSTTNDPRFADGVISGVIRNGFVEEGQQVIRQPEVIVNRMR